MRRFHSTSEKAESAAERALVALAGTSGLLLWTLFQDGMNIVALTSAGAAVVIAAVTFARLRAAAGRPALEITDTHLKWRTPGKAKAVRLPLSKLTDVQRRGSTVRVVHAGILHYDIPLDALRLRAGSFAAHLIEAELTRHIDAAPGRRRVSN